jgi:uncharacterized protein (TIGR03084 family)
VSEVATLVADLAAEQAALRDLVGDIDDDHWLAPTPAWGWDVRDTISHLAHIDEMAVSTVRGDDGAINTVAERSASGEDLTYRGVLRGRNMGGPEVLAWWDASSAVERDVLLALDPSLRVPWGIGMRAPSLITARLMETWAHGLDVFTALSREPVDTDRLAHVAWLATRALPYAYSVAGEEPPAAPLFVELTLPSGARWTFGPEDASDRIRGTASDYCRVFVQRRRVADTSLDAEGDAAARALAVARAYL